MMRDALLEQFRAEPKRIFHLRELMKAIQAPPGDARTARRMLRGLIRDGLVESYPGSRYRAARRETAIDGLLVAERGHLKFRSAERGRQPTYPLLAPYPAHAQAGLKAKAILRPKGRKGQWAAELIELADAQFEGTSRIIEERGRAIAETLEVPPRRFRLGPEADHSSLLGHLVRLRIDAKTGAATIQRDYGRDDDFRTHFARVSAEMGLPDGFPEEVDARAASFDGSEIAREAPRREDLRALPLVTIDGATAKDFDDAVFAHPKDDHFEVIVAIADVSFYVRPGDAIDREAQARGTSQYLGDRVIPMLPEVLSNEYCSLKPDVDRLAVVVKMDIDRKGRTLRAQTQKAIIRSHARLTYDAVAAYFQSGTLDAPIAPQNLDALREVANALSAHRHHRGALALSLSETELRFDDNGQPSDSVARRQNEAHRLIESLMIAANEAVARDLTDREIPGLFRAHEDPDPARLEALVSALHSLGHEIELPDSPPPKLLRDALAPAMRDPDLGPPLQHLLLRSLAQAKYAPRRIPHYALASTHYLHFTSPIRRYPDLVVHRALFGAPIEDPARLESVAEHCSVRERSAIQAERRISRIAQAFVAQQHIGEVFEGRITGIAGRGVFVETPAPRIEGMVALSTFPGDRYLVSASGLSLRGARSGRRIALGDHVAVRLVASDPARERIDFAYAGEDAPRRSARRDAGSRRRRPRSGDARTQPAPAEQKHSKKSSKKAGKKPGKKRPGPRKPGRKRRGPKKRR